MNNYTFIPGISLGYDYDLYLYEMEIIPYKARVGNDVWKIEVPNHYVIRKIRFFIIKDQILIVYLDAPHPNSHPLTFKYCLPNNILYKNLDNNSLHFLTIHCLPYYNLNNCYFKPKDIKYRKLIGKGGIDARFFGS